MNSIDTLREFFGWCSVINIGMLTLSSILIIAIRGFASQLHAKLFGLDEDAVRLAYFHYLGQYKIAIIVLNIVPYFTLLLMS